MMPRFLVLVLAMLALVSYPAHDATARPSKAAKITKIYSGGIGYVSTGQAIDGSYSASIGKWGDPYTGGINGPPIPGIEPVGNSILYADITVNDGGIVAFKYQIESYDIARYNWLNVHVETPDGGTLPLVSQAGAPGEDWGRYYKTPVPILKTYKLDKWRNQKVRLIFSVYQDGYGDQTRALISGLQVRTCPVAPLTPLKDPTSLWQEANPNTPNTGSLEPRLKEGIQCLDAKFGRTPSNSGVSSAYRPLEYQLHIKDVWEGWMGSPGVPALRTDGTNVCTDLRGIYSTESDRHGLVSPPGGTGSLHITNDAFDYSKHILSTVTSRQIYELAKACKLCRTVRGDRVHFQYFEYTDGGPVCINAGEGQ